MSKLKIGDKINYLYPYMVFDREDKKTGLLVFHYKHSNGTIREIKLSRENAQVYKDKL